MFGSVGWGEILVLLIAALVIFGPDKLPGATKQAADTLKSLRKQLTGARQQITDEFGDIAPNFDPAMLNPKEFVRKHLLEDLDEDEVPANVMDRYTPQPATAPAASSTPSAAAALVPQAVLYDEETT
ncbi:MAG: twin-arginine translocase TatA/TatE family subunit [Antricoccus sp.]